MEMRPPGRSLRDPGRIVYSTPKEAAMSERPIGPQTGDLARRVTQRRVELGLSQKEVAHRACMSWDYFEYLEHSPDSTLTEGALERLAVALDTTTAALEGGDVDRAPGRGRARSHAKLRTLTQEECEAHLAAGGVGRIVFSSERGPEALPVNFAYDSGYVVFSTDESMASAIRGERLVGFEVDRIDEAVSEGWSVMVTGRAHFVVQADVRQRLEALHVEPWAGGRRDTLVRIEPDALSGRVIVQGSAAAPA
jgi:nitroimidazol reductase NimA-like FMN-containing flavoprotein (pyridoxamine 5'-phosphate oxidase superfamily)